MTLDDFVQDFARHAADAISIGYRGWSDEHAKVHWVNPAFTKLFGFAPDDIIGLPVDETLHPNADDPILRQVRRRFDAGETALHFETDVRHQAGHDIWVSISVCAVEAADGRGRFGAAIYRDLTDLKSREDAAHRALSENARLLEEARAAQNRLLNALNAMPDPIAIWDEAFRLVIANNAFAPRLLARDTPLAVGTDIGDMLKEAAWSGQFRDAIGREDTWWHEANAAFRAGTIRDRTEYTDGRVYSANSHKTPDKDTIVVTMDVTEIEERRRSLEAAHEDLRHQTLHDDLTGLGNRRKLSERLRHCAAVGETPLAAIQIELDRFKNINDTIGHDAGDCVLAETAQRLASQVSGDDLVARIGGDEFVVLTTGRSDVEQFARGLIQAVSRPIMYQGASLRVGASAGIARTPVSAPEDLLTNADIALYKAKSAGRGRVAVFEIIDKSRLREQKALADDVLRAIEAREFVPVYQPQVSATTGRITSFEVLARWAHPKRGLLAPTAFLRAADDLNMLHDTDRIIFNKAMAECIPAFDGPDAPGLAFNVSQGRVMSPDILQDAQRTAEYPGDVAFELLETIFFEEETEAFLLQVDAIRDAGVAIEIDDFGTGRASIVALQRIAPDRLKIDRGLVAPVVRSDGSRKLARSIIDIGRALGIKVTAEVVETAAHAEILSAYGCDRLQGFHYSAPIRFDSAMALFSGQSSTKVA